MKHDDEAERPSSAYADDAPTPKNTGRVFASIAPGQSTEAFAAALADALMRARTDEEVAAPLILTDRVTRPSSADAEEDGDRS